MLGPSGPIDGLTFNRHNLPYRKWIGGGTLDRGRLGRRQRQAPTLGSQNGDVVRLESRIARDDDGVQAKCLPATITASAPATMT
jgi:hypothetical protein